MEAPPTVGELEERLAIPPDAGAFTEDELGGLPEPVQRFFRTAIAPGTPLARSARLRMTGSIRLGSRWVRFHARQILAPRHGFVWSGRAGGVMAGSDRFADGRGAIDWRILGLIRVASGEGYDVARSSAGRCGLEAIWVPTTLLPRFGVEWEAVTPNDIIARYGVGEAALEVHSRIDEDGRMRSVVFDRWGDPENDGVFGLHPFGVSVTGSASFDGVTIPSAGRAGWYFGTDRWDEGEFFRYRITQLDLVRGRTDTIGEGTGT